MDPASAVAGILGIVQLSAQAVSLCQTYYVGARDARASIAKLRVELTGFCDALAGVADLVGEEGAEAAEEATQGQSKVQRLAVGRLVDPQGEFLAQCRAEVEALLARLGQGDGEKEMRAFGLRALKWPLSVKEVNKMLATIERYKSTIGVAIEKDNLAKNLSNELHLLELKSKTDGIADALGHVKEGGVKADIARWLQAPDSSVDYEAAQAKCTGGTGGWLTTNKTFQDWLRGWKSLVWLSGPPGYGKTIICSTILKRALEEKSADSKTAVAYFFFDWKEEAKRETEKCVRSLLIQLAEECGEFPVNLRKLYSECASGLRQPSRADLVLLVCDILKQLPKTFVVIDALDECNDIPSLVEFIRDLTAVGKGKISIMVASRRLRDLEEGMTELADGEIPIERKSNQNDIGLVIRQRLEKDRMLRKWPPQVQREIEDTLTRKSHGMFRWVVCQLDALRRCFKLNSLRKALESLPTTLDETYERIIASFDSSDHEDVYKVLQWLAFAARPLTTVELNEAFAVIVKEQLYYDSDERLPDPRDFMTLCSGLATVYSVAKTEINSLTRPDGFGVRSVSDKFDFHAARGTDMIQISHFSVQEYLVSDRIRDGPARTYALNAGQSHLNLAKTCLIYLLLDEFGTGPCQGSQAMRERLDKYPFLTYAAQNWPFHFKNTPVVDQDLTDLSSALMNPNRIPHFMSWVQLLVLRRHSQRSWSWYAKFATPLYYAASFGLVEVVKWLIQAGVDVSQPGGTFGGTALHAARWRGYDEIAGLLIDAGIDESVTDFNNMTASALASQTPYRKGDVSAGYRK